MKNKRMNFTPSKAVKGMLSPVEAAKEFKAMVSKAGRPQKFNRYNGLAAEPAMKVGKYTMINGIPHKIVDGKYVALTSK